MIYKKGEVVEENSKPLTITKTQRTAMVEKAKTYLPMSEDNLKKALETFYIYGQDTMELKAGYKSKHYTSAQLNDIVEQVKLDEMPDEVVPEE